MTQAAHDRIAVRTLSGHACALFAPLLAATSAWGGDIGLAWDSVSDSQLAGYIVYYGSTAGTYAGSIDVGNRTSYTVSGLPDGATYHFVVTAYDKSRVQSAFSNDAFGTVVAGAASAWNDAGGATVTVAEYFNASLAHYFITSNRNEITVLDNGVVEGWSRTGETFKAYVASDAPALGIAPVCRFYGRPDAGLDTHFFSASSAECDDLLAAFAQGWILESPSVFYVYLPDAETGSCRGGTVPVYRVYNKRADANHRYTTSLSLRRQMTDEGWVVEGYGPDAVGMCAPS